MGDLNAEPQDEFIQELLGAGFQDAWLAKNPEPVIDFCVCSKHVLVLFVIPSIFQP